MVVAHPWQDTEWVIVGMGGRACKRACAYCKFSENCILNVAAY
jgi:lipoate synthase